MLHPRKAPEPEDPPEWRADRAFFAKHPEREYYIRRFIRGEVPGEPEYLPPCPGGYRRWTIVRQLAPGLRMRLFVSLEGEPARGEHAVSRLWALMCDPEWLDQAERFKAAAGAAMGLEPGP